MKAISHNLGPRKPPADDRPVGVGQVDAHHPNPVPAAQGVQVGGEFRFAPAGAQVKDPPVLQVAKGRREALAAMERVLVDAEHLRTIQAKTFLGLALRKLRVDASDGGLAQGLPPSQGRGTDPVIVALIDLLAPRFRAAPA